MSLKNNRRDHVARVQSKSDPDTRPSDPQSPPFRTPHTPPPHEMSEEKLSWIDGLQPPDTPISNISQPIPAPPPEYKTPPTPPPIHNPRPPQPSQIPAPEPESNIAPIIPASPISRRSVWDEPIPPSAPEPDEPRQPSPSTLLAPESIIVSTAPPSPPKNIRNLPPEMEWLVEYADTRNAIKLDRDRDES